MNRSLKDVATPIIRHDAIKVEKYGEKVVVRIMLMKYDDMIEVYYQEEGHPYEFAYGVASFEGFKETLRMAQLNVYNWGLHYEE